MTHGPLRVRLVTKPGAPSALRFAAVALRCPTRPRLLIRWAAAGGRPGIAGETGAVCYRPDVPPALSVVIPTHGRAPLLSQILPPLMADEAAAEILVVVDGLDAPTLAVLEAVPNSADRLRWSVLEPNQGLVRAKCHGTRLATGDVVLQLDDDVRPHEGLASGHLRYHQQGGHLVVVGSMHVDPDVRRSVLGRVVARNYEKAYETAVEGYASNPGSILDGLWAGNVSAPRADLRAMEPEILESSMFAHEDRHLGLVAKRHGMAAVFDPDLAADHLYVKEWAGMLTDAEAFGRAQRVLAELHPQLRPFDADGIPEPLNPLVAQAVLLSDHPGARGAELASLKVVTWLSEALGARKTAERLAFAAAQIARRRGRRLGNSS